MRTRIIQGLSVVLLLLAVVWFLNEPGYEPVITALAALVGLVSAEFIKGPRGAAGEADDDAQEKGDSRPSIAVLPFQDFSPDPADAYFAHGMHEEIITQLQKISGLAVRGRTSVQGYGGSPHSIPEIAAKLGVTYILEGSARKAGGQVRLTAQLIDARRDEHLWAENYDRPLSLESLFAVQTEIARQVAGELAAVLTPEDLRRVESRPTRNLEAYELYLRGQHHAHRYNRAGWESAIKLFQDAVHLDPGFAHAYAGMGYSYKELAHLQYIPSQEGYAKAAECLETAIRLDGTLGDAYATLGATRATRDWDMRGAEELFRKALQLSPESSDVRMQYGTFLTWNGRFDEAIAQAQESLRLDPLGPIVNTWAAVAHFYARRHEESIGILKGLLDLDPFYAWAHMYLAHNYGMLGMAAEGLYHAEKVEEVSRATGDRSFLAYLGSDYPRLGRPERTEEILEIALALYAEHSIDAVTVGVKYGVLGRRDEAFQWLSRAVDEKSGMAVYLKVYGLTFLEDMAADPRYVAILERIGFQS